MLAANESAVNKPPSAGVGFPAYLRCALQEFLDRYKDILATSVIALVNAALCDYHVRSCPPSPQLTSVCSQAFRLWHEVEQEMKDLEWNFNCTDHNVSGYCADRPAGCLA